MTPGIYIEASPEGAWRLRPQWDALWRAADGGYSRSSAACMACMAAWREMVAPRGGPPSGGVAAGGAAGSGGHAADLMALHFVLAAIPLGASLSQGRGMKLADPDTAPQIAWCDGVGDSAGCGADAGADWLAAAAQAGLGRQRQQARRLGVRAGL